MASIHHIKYKKVTDRRRTNAIGKWDERYKKLYSTTRLGTPTTASKQRLRKNAASHDSRMKEKVVGISRQSIINQHRRRSTNQDKSNKNENLIDRVFPSPPQNSLNVLSMISNANFEGKNCALPQSKQHVQRRPTPSIPKNGRKIYRPMSGKRRRIVKHREQNQIQTSRGHKYYFKPTLRPKSAKVRNESTNRDRNMAWINALDIFDRNNKMVNVVTQQNASHDKEKSMMALELIQNYRAHVLRRTKHNPTPTIFEQGHFFFNILNDTNQKYLPKNIRPKRRPSSAPQRRKRVNPQRPHTAKPQPPPRNSVVPKRYERPLDKLLSRLREYDSLPRNEKKAFCNKNILVARTDKNGTINYDDAVLSCVHVSDKVVRVATKMAYDRRTKMEQY